MAQSHNYRERWQDPTAHAETIVIREAAKALGRLAIIDTTLYVTLEPCAMCLGAMILARIPASCSRPKILKPAPVDRYWILPDNPG